MCIIVAKPAGVDMPAMETLENCWLANPDGAGIMVALDGKVHIEKGIMTWNDFEKRVNGLAQRHDMRALSLVFHFRISTHAGVNPQNTHPFPITASQRALVALRSTSSIGGVAHNGIIPCCSTSKKKERFSDTFYFVRDFAANLIKDPATLKAKWMQRVLEEIAQSKLAFLLPDGEQVLIGKFTRENGVAYSNDTYKVYAHGWADVDTYLYPCSEDMCFYDEELGDYCECDPDTHMFDEYGELWFFDADSRKAYPLYFAVLNENLDMVKPTKEKGMCFTCNSAA